jgi:hypothetical protein
VDSPPKRDSAEARNMPKNAARTPSRVHAVLAGVIVNVCSQLFRLARLTASCFMQSTITSTSFSTLRNFHVLLLLDLFPYL